MSSNQSFSVRIHSLDNQPPLTESAFSQRQRKYKVYQTFQHKCLGIAMFGLMLQVLRWRWKQRITPVQSARDDYSAIVALAPTFGPGFGQVGLTPPGKEAPHRQRLDLFFRLHHRTPPATARTPALFLVPVQAVASCTPSPTSTPKPLPTTDVLRLRSFKHYAGPAPLRSTTFPATTQYPPDRPPAAAVSPGPGPTSFRFSNRGMRCSRLAASERIAPWTKSEAEKEGDTGHRSSRTSTLDVRGHPILLHHRNATEHFVGHLILARVSRSSSLAVITVTHLSLMAMLMRAHQPLRQAGIPISQVLHLIPGRHGHLRPRSPIRGGQPRGPLQKRSPVGQSSTRNLPSAERAGIGAGSWMGKGREKMSLVPLDARLIAPFTLYGGPTKELQELQELGGMTALESGSIPLVFCLRLTNRLFSSPSAATALVTLIVLSFPKFSNKLCLWFKEGGGRLRPDSSALDLVNSTSQNFDHA
ncbi:uncharacterized protein CLUP02_13926 [Colletotrichum lupini]|uniref:Uncharacterized protein n=1 Tax=Colletotrichum lupini TaxID=145971 RepID=A0A9Q8WML0_9PEZI|nr:uncharacterized protein CLUP02_13926 [Colletotrichum lupini]UQC88402.1 hypothetical protein CLUP02_13926 [Colletotrichum lupini]